MMTPHLDSEIMQQTIRLRRSWLVTPSSLFLQGSLKGAIAELFRTFQGVIVPERPAVHCSMRGRRQQCHPKQVPLTRRVGRLQSHRFSSASERTMQADFCCSRAPQAVPQGAPLDCSNGTHCSAAWSMAPAG